MTVNVKIPESDAAQNDLDQERILFPKDKKNYWFGKIKLIKGEKTVYFSPFGDLNY
jgi:hypothetical protein